MARQRNAPKILVKGRWETDRRCILGVRVSEGRDRGHERISEDVQEGKARRQADAHQLTVVHMYQEIGISGDAERAALEEAIQLIEARGAAWLVVAEVDRLGRDVRDIYNTFHRIHAAGGCVLIAEPLMNSADENSRIVLNLLASLAESQRFKIARKWSEAQENAWQRGVYPGDTPLGYRNPEPGEVDNPGHPVLQIVPAEADALRKVARALVDDAITWPAAAAMLASLGYDRTVKGVYHLFSNRVLIGEVSFGERPTVRNAHEAILSTSDFEAINGRRVTRVSAQENSPQVLGAGTLRCAGCRHTLANRTSGERKHYYCRTAWCESRVKNLNGPETDTILKGLALDAQTWLEDLSFDGVTDDGARTVAEIDAELEDLRVKARNYALLLVDDPTDADLREGRDILKARIVEREAERTARTSVEGGLRVALMSEDVWNSTDIAGRIEAVRSVLDAVFVTADGRMFPHTVGTYTLPLPRKGVSVPRAAYVPTEVRV